MAPDLQKPIYIGKTIVPILETQDWISPIDKMMNIQVDANTISLMNNIMMCVESCFLAHERAGLCPLLVANRDDGRGPYSFILVDWSLAISCSTLINLVDLILASGTRIPEG
jgi:hypothetical protein